MVERLTTEEMARLNRASLGSLQELAKNIPGAKVVTYGHVEVWPDMYSKNGGLRFNKKSGEWEDISG